MNDTQLTNIIEISELHDRAMVFRDRRHAGKLLAGMMEDYKDRSALVLAIPAGGLPVAAEVAGRLALPLDVAVVSKITLPWNTEAGYGAIAFDGTVRLNDDLVARLHLSQEQIEQGVADTSAKIRRRVVLFRGDRSETPLSDRTVILVDDGLASGFTMLVAVEAIRKARASEVLVATPTGHDAAVKRIAAQVDRMYCANIRSGWRFAVADAYEYWSDVTEEEALLCLSE